MLLVDTHEKRIIQDAELKMEIARRRPHSAWLKDQVLSLLVFHSAQSVVTFRHREQDSPLSVSSYISCVQLCHNILGNLTRLIIYLCVAWCLMQRHLFLDFFKLSYVLWCRAVRAVSHVDGKSLKLVHVSSAAFIVFPRLCLRI